MEPSTADLQLLQEASSSNTALKTQVIEFSSCLFHNIHKQL